MFLRSTKSSKPPVMERAAPKKVVKQDYDPVKLLDMFTPEQVFTSCNLSSDMCSRIWMLCIQNELVYGTCFIPSSNVPT